jgi:hypothetical protein
MHGHMPVGVVMAMAVGIGGNHARMLYYNITGVYNRRPCGMTGGDERCRERRHCERSEAIHLSACCVMDCFASLAMTARHTFAFSPHAFARALPDSCRLTPEKGAGNAGRSMRPTVSCARWGRKAHTSIQVTPVTPGIPHAMVYGLLRALPGAPGFLATVACATSRRLDTSVGVPGPHAFSVRKKVLSSRAPPASTASRPAFATIMIRPFWWDGTAGNIG